MTNITVFGAANTQPGEPLYEQSLRLGSLIAGAGWGVLTGGYIGTMEAVSRGAAEAGGHVIGVTCDEIEAWRPVRPNRWVMEERRYPTNLLRLSALIQGCDAALALPGGVGTLAELAVLWSQLQTQAVAPRPFLAIGPGWGSVIEAFLGGLGDYVRPADRQWITPVEDVDGAVENLKAYFQAAA
jgi:uncharacterized protein (TIGR00730 family)